MHNNHNSVTHSHFFLGLLNENSTAPASGSCASVSSDLKALYKSVIIISAMYHVGLPAYCINSQGEHQRHLSHFFPKINL